MSLPVLPKRKLSGSPSDAVPSFSPSSAPPPITMSPPLELIDTEVPPVSTSPPVPPLFAQNTMFPAEEVVIDFVAVFTRTSRPALKLSPPAPAVVLALTRTSRLAVALKPPAPAETANPIVTSSVPDRVTASSLEITPSCVIVPP